MSSGKRGRPYLYPASLISGFSALLLFLSYRTLTAVLNQLLGINMHYTTPSKRLMKEYEQWRFRRVKRGVVFYR